MFVAVPAASGASLAQMDPRQDEQWVENHKPDYPEQTDSTADVEASAAKNAESQR
ncbi:hypothetical protein ORJ00_07750 [Rheinheimera baltica]|uniref:hypothetical protein n=1 Tax=Rheinheimera baltica TaxID=67576 RepID=UPI00273DE0C7|nr:hypothetical protein [Rheinheimera baltica]MDP5142629.1 hypothetical protein [Rheinheimera baltica]